MNGTLFTLFLLTATVLGFSQSEKVSLLEENQGKRTHLFVQNHTADTLNVFLRVAAEGFRRSADKPILKDLLPHSKTKMTTLIALEGIPSTYTYDLIVNEFRDNAISVAHDSEVIDISETLNGKLVLFTKGECGKCQLLEALLTSEHIPHQNFNIEEDMALYEQLLQFLEKQNNLPETLNFPIIWDREKVLFGYEDLQEVLNRLRK